MFSSNLKTKIFLDGGDPKETKEIISLLGFLDGQTTNPSLISKNPVAQARVSGGNKFLKAEAMKLYKDIVVDISSLIPDGSVSIEVYADKDTSSNQMISEAIEMNSWIPNAHIKLPITFQGLIAAESLVKNGVRVNMTLCFSQDQAAAVYSATKTKGADVFISPFVGRLDDKGIDGMSLVNSIQKMYQPGDGHVKVLVASVRSMDHFLDSLKIEADIITAPGKIIKDWIKMGKKLPDKDFFYNPSGLKNINLKKMDLNSNWKKFNIRHELTDIGLQKFADDWNSIIEN